MDHALAQAEFAPQGTFLGRGFSELSCQWLVANASRRRGSLDEKLGNRVAFYEHEDSRHHWIADLSGSLKGVSEAVYADTGSQNRPIPSL